MTEVPPTAATVGGLLRTATEQLRAAGSETARLDAELLLGHLLDVERSTVLAHPEVPVGESRRSTYAAVIARRARGEPVAYLRGVKEFYGLAFSVDQRALIPRPETERLVELALEHVRRILTGAPRAVDLPPLRVWDVGTGSGAIAVTLSLLLIRRGYRGAFAMTATDRSPDALALAVENAVAHGVADVIDFALGDLLDIPDAPSGADLIVANLPYIPSADVRSLPVAASFEPVAALDGGRDGLELIRRLLADLPGRLAEPGRALLEIGDEQAEGALAAAAAELPGWPATIEADLGGRPRVLVVERS